MRLRRLKVSLSLAALLLSLAHADAHRDGCHRQHSCPSTSATYTCGDRGHCTQCPDNAYCLSGQPRQGTTSPTTPTAPPVPHEQFTGKVVGLSDGDTLQVLRNGKAVKVRLYGIDAPEKAQPFGTRARQYASELVFHEIVTVLVQDTDRYGRLIGQVLLDDGQSVSQALVRAGMAWWYAQYAPHDTTLAFLEAQARAEKHGLWSDPEAVPPWAWRKGKRP